MRSNILFILIFFSISGFCAPVVHVSPSQDYFLVNEVDYFLDAEHTYTIEKAIYSNNWQPITASNVNFSFIQETLWLHFTISATQTGKWYLKIPYPLIDYLSNYSFINQKALKTIHTGDMRPFSSRAVRHPHFVFPYDLTEGDKLDIYLQVRSKGASEVPLQFITEDSYESDNRLRVFLLGWMNGILIVMMLYNLVIYFFIKDKTYIAYVITVGFYILGTGMYNGTAFQYFFPNNATWNEALYPIINGFYHFFNVVFIYMILEIKRRSKTTKYLFNTILIFSASILPLAFFMDYQFIVPIQVFLALVLNFMGFLMGIYLSIKKEKTAMFFTVAWGLYILGMVIANLKALGYLEANWFTLYVYQIGVFIQVSVLSVALAQRIDQQSKDSINTLERYKNLYNSTLSGQFTLDRKGVIIDANPAFGKMLGYSSVEEVIKLSKENHRENFHADELTPRRIFKELSSKGHMFDLQTQLKNKLGELIWFSVSVQSIRNKKDEITSYQGSIIDIQERKRSEENKKRAMRERMLAMEHLVVGICHEINTPLGVSRTAISQLRDDFQFLNQSYENKELTKAIFSQRLEIENEAIDIINQNLNRINNLISEFKEASVLQKGYKFESGNLKYILEEINLILSKRIGKDNIKISCSGDIHFIGYPRAINDMLTNLYTNSISHGFDEGNGVIRISAKMIKDNIEIKIKDNGIGIASHRVRDIFNPFYTSKRGSKGSIGLGLFQVFNIATQLLDGDIDVVNTHPGVEFTITFPAILIRIEDRGAQHETAKVKLIQ